MQAHNLINLRRLPFLSLFTEPKTKKTLPMLYGGKLGDDFTHVFEVFDMDLGTWSVLSPSPVSTPPMATVKPFLRLEAFNPRMMLYYDTGQPFLWVYTSGRWGRMETKLKVTDYREGYYVLVPRNLVCL